MQIFYAFKLKSLIHNFMLLLTSRNVFLFLVFWLARQRLSIKAFQQITIVVDGSRKKNFRKDVFKLSADEQESHQSSSSQFDTSHEFYLFVTSCWFHNNFPALTISTCEHFTTATIDNAMRMKSVVIFLFFH